MTQFNKNTLFSLFSLGMICVSAADAQACNRGGGGGYSRSSSYNQSYSQPSYSHNYVPSYNTSYSRPISHQNYSQPVSYSTPVIHPPTQQFSQPVQQQQFSQVSQQPQNFQQVPQQQQQFAQAPQQQQQAQSPPQHAQAPQQHVQAPQQVPTQVNAQQSAMQMLAAFGEEPTQQASTPIQPQGFNGVGTWNATLPNNAIVTLVMQEDGNFTWTAVNNGKQSTFQGSYNLTNSSLTLSRSNDSQKLDGALTFNGDSFTFKINGSNDNGLTFNRG